MTKFYLGTHEPAWLARLDVPLFVSRRRLARRVALPIARGRWALDSGGFTELDLFGGWTIPPSQYADEVATYADRVGNLDFAPIQDWMCEPHIIAKTGLSVHEHQTRSVQSWLDLTALAPRLPWVPVLQGWHLEDYLTHVEMYRSAGVDLSRQSLVGVGSVCRRQATKEATRIFASLAKLGLRLHGFGVKIDGLKTSSIYLDSSDSLAWSRAARSPDRSPLPGCTHKSCANCARFALAWREGVVANLGKRCQAVLVW